MATMGKILRDDTKFDIVHNIASYVEEVNSNFVSKKIIITRQS